MTLTNSICVLYGLYLFLFGAYKPLTPPELTEGALLCVMGGHSGHMVHTNALGLLSGQRVLQLHQQHGGGAVHQVQHTLVDAHGQLGESEGLGVG